MSPKAQKDRIKAANARPFVHVYPVWDGDSSIVITIPANARKRDILRVLQDHAGESVHILITKESA